MLKIKSPVASEKNWFLGEFWIRYCHRYPQEWSSSHWGFVTSHAKGFTVDFHLGRHVVTFLFRRL